MAKKNIIIPRRDGMVAEFLLNGNANDTAGTNNGTATNVTYTNTDRGYQKQTGVFNGSSAYIERANSFLSGFTAVSWGAWVNTTTSADKEIMTSNNVNAVYTLRMLTGGTLQWRVYAGGSHTSIQPTNTINDGKWHFVIGTWDGSNMYLYLDGVQIGTATKSGSAGSLDSVFRIGSYPTGVQFWNGGIQSVRIFNRAISATEIQNWYLEGLRKLGGGSMSGLLDGLVAYYDMKGDANDIVGGNNGTVSGAVLTTDYFGFSNSSYDFDGTNDIITAGGVAITTAYTVFGISKFDTIGTGAGERYIFRLHNSGTSILYFMTYQDKWYVYHSGGAKVLQPTSPTPSTGTYYYWAITYNGSTVELYVNGASAGTVGSATTLGANNTLDIGGRAGVGFQDGINDCMLFMNRAMSATEVKAVSDLFASDDLLPYL